MASIPSPKIPRGRVSKLAKSDLERLKLMRAAVQLARAIVVFMRWELEAQQEELRQLQQNLRHLKAARPDFDPRILTRDN